MDTNKNRKFWRNLILWISFVCLAISLASGLIVLFAYHPLLSIIYLLPFILVSFCYAFVIRYIGISIFDKNRKPWYGHIRGFLFLILTISLLIGFINFPLIAFLKGKPQSAPIMTVSMQISFTLLWTIVLGALSCKIDIERPKIQTSYYAMTTPRFENTTSFQPNKQQNRSGRLKQK